MKHLARRPTLYFLLFFAMLFVLIKCTSQDVVVEVVSETSPSPSPSATAEPVPGDSAEVTPAPVPTAPTTAMNVSPAFTKLIRLLKSKGYEGIGLEFEDDVMLEMLIQVFSDPATNSRKLKTIYTGAVNAYDARASSITIAKSTNAKEILTFVKKKIPLRSKKASKR